MSLFAAASNQSTQADLPTASVIVLNYNTCEHLEACFRSLQTLIYPKDKLELILVDNASTDASVATMQANFAEVKVIVNDKNYGFSGGNNIGAQKAQGEVIAFLNPDMRVDPRWLVELVKLLAADPEIAVAGSKILSWDGQTIDFAGGAANFYGYGYQNGFGQESQGNFDQVKPTLFVCGGAMLARRQVFLEVGGFDDDFFAYYEDVDLGWRLWILGYKIIFAPAAVVYHHHHGSWQKVSHEKRRVLYERNAFFTMLKNYEQAQLNQILPAALLLLIKRTYLAAGIDDSFFRLGAPTQPAQTSAALPAPQSNYPPGYYLKEAWRTLTHAGLNGLFIKFKAELRRRERRKQREQLPGSMQLDQITEQAVIPVQALSYLVAGNDIITLYAKMLEKRKLIQAHRRRSDQEILELFGRPLDSSELWPEYQQAQAYLVQLFGIDTIFKTR